MHCAAKCAATLTSPDLLPHLSSLGIPLTAERVVLITLITRMMSSQVKKRSRRTQRTTDQVGGDGERWNRVVGGEGGR